MLMFSSSPLLAKLGPPSLKMAPPHPTWIFTHQFNLSEMPSQTCPEVGFPGDSKLQVSWQWRLTLNKHRHWTDIKILPGFVTGFNGKIITLTSVQRKFYGVGVGRNWIEFVTNMFKYPLCQRPMKQPLQSLEEEWHKSITTSRPQRILSLKEQKV